MTPVLFRQYFFQFISLACLIIFALTLSSCSFTPDRPAPDSVQPPFVAPTLVPTPKPVISPASNSGKNTDGNTCQNNLRYVSDVTIPDGMVVMPGATIDKRWSVENNGTCNWDKRYRLRLIAGEEMGADTEQALFPARSGAQVEILIQFTAPAEEGRYLTSWKAVDPDGNLFGDPIYMEINVGRKPSD